MCPGSCISRKQEIVAATATVWLSGCNSKWKQLHRVPGVPGPTPGLEMRIPCLFPHLPPHSCKHVHLALLPGLRFESPHLSYFF